MPLDDEPKPIIIRLYLSVALFSINEKYTLTIYICVLINVSKSTDYMFKHFF